MRTRIDDPFIDLRSVAQLLGVSPDTVRLMANDATFPHAIKLGRGKRRHHLRWRLAEIRAFMAGKGKVPA
jgi:predicted DNA-binding transcriptional regulator AlpA